MKINLLLPNCDALLTNTLIGSDTISLKSIYLEISLDSTLVLFNEILNFKNILLNSLNYKNEKNLKKIIYFIVITCINF